MNTIGKKGLAIIMHFEQLHDGDLSQIGLQPKMCPAGIWTVGYGRALTDKKGNFLRGEQNKAKAYALYPSLTPFEAEQMLIEDGFEYSQKVYNLFTSLKLSLMQHQFDALVSFTYNCGIGALYNYEKKKEMAVLRAIRSNRGIANAFGLWVNARGKVLPGLVRRRKSEATLYLTGEVEFYT